MDKKLGRMCELARATAQELYATMSVNASPVTAENITEIHWNDKFNGHTAETNSEENLPESFDVHERVIFTPNIERSRIIQTKLKQSPERKNSSQKSSSDDFPYEWFKEYMETMKKDMVKEISIEVIRSVTELLNKQLQLKPSCAQEYNHITNEHEQTVTKQYDFPTSDKQCMQQNQYKMQDELVEYENVRPRKLNKKNSYSKVETEGRLEMEAFQRYPNRIFISSVNNLDEGGRKQTDCIASENLTMSQAVQLAEELSLLQPKVQEAACSRCDIQEASAHGENQLRMNCSITGHQMFHKSHCKDPMDCSGSDIDNISICSIASNNSDARSENNFEVIHLLPNSESKVSNCINVNHILYNQKTENNCSTGASDTAGYNHVTCKDENSSGSRDSPSFELLSESGSPSLSVYINDECPCHNENSIESGTREMEYVVTEQDTVVASSLSNPNDTSLQPESVKELYNKSDSLKAANSREKELRMNCSITGHQILNKANVKNVMLCSASEKDSINLCFSNGNDVEAHCDHTFEVVQIPQCGEAVACNKSNETLYDRKVKNDSPMNLSNNTIYHVGSDKGNASGSVGNFESLPDMASSALSIYKNDDNSPCNESSIHAGEKANVTKCKNDDDKHDSNALKYCPRQTNVNEKLCANYDADNCDSVGWEKRAGGTYSFVAETLPGRAKEKSMCPLSKSENLQQLRPGRTNDVNVDVKNSHTSYPIKVESDENAWSNIPLNNCNHSQQQPDANEFAQSFHSHTTSITDNDGCTAERVMTSSQESFTVDHMTDKIAHDKHTYCWKSSNPEISSPKKVSFSVESLPHKSPVYCKKISVATQTSFCVSNVSTRATYCSKTPDSKRTRPNRYSYHVPILLTGDTQEKWKPSQKFGEKRERNADPRKYSSNSTGVTAEPVQILPETLVTGMPHVASLACHTARRVCDKLLRRHVKEISYESTKMNLDHSRNK